MIDTKLPATKEVLLDLVQCIASNQTLALYKTEIRDCKTIDDRLEWLLLGLGSYN